MKEAPVIFFDGVCHLCNRSVQFIIRHDPEGYFRFAPLQSEYAEKQLTKLGQPNKTLDSLILICDNKVYDKSTAALKIATHLSGGWRLCRIFLLVPRFLRDSIYDFIARHRYKWFGRRDTCMRPRPEWKQRFLE